MRQRLQFTAPGQFETLLRQCVHRLSVEPADANQWFILTQGLEGARRHRTLGEPPVRRQPGGRAVGLGGRPRGSGSSQDGDRPAGKARPGDRGAVVLNGHNMFNRLAGIPADAAGDSWRQVSLHPEVSFQEGR